MFILHVLLILLCLQFVISADSNVLITTEENSTECGRSKTLSCKVKKFTFAVEWLQDKDPMPIAKCIKFYDYECRMNSKYNGIYQFTHAVNQGVFNLTIMNVTRHDEGRKLMCSDGTNKDIYDLKVEDHKLRVRENAIKRTLTVETGCVYQGMDVYFRWTKKDLVSKKEIPFEPQFRFGNVTHFTEDCECGNNQQVKRSESIFAIRGNAKYNLKIEANYENGHIEILELKDTFEVHDVRDSTYDASTDDNTVVGIAIGVSVLVIIIVCVIVVILYIFIKYRRNRNIPSKPVVRIKSPCHSSIFSMYITNTKAGYISGKENMTKYEERTFAELLTAINNATEEERCKPSCSALAISSSDQGLTENKTNAKEQKTTNAESIGDNNTKPAYRVFRLCSLTLIVAIYSEDQEEIVRQYILKELENVTSLKEQPNDNKGGHYESSRSDYGDNTSDVEKDHSDHANETEKMDPVNRANSCQLAYDINLDEFKNEELEKSQTTRYNTSLSYWIDTDVEEGRRSF